jgi:hypothetical protein
MLAIPPNLQGRFEETLRDKAIPNKLMGPTKNGSGITLISATNTVFLDKKMKVSSPLFKSLDQNGRQLPSKSKLQRQ